MNTTSRQQWQLKDIIILIAAIIFILALHGAVPFLMMPTLGQAVWTMGFSQSFANGPWYSIYAHDFGIPQPAAIAFGLSAAWPASLLIRLGLHPADAYSGIFAFYFLLAFFSAYHICIRLGMRRYCSILGGVAWVGMPIIWAHNGYSMIELGIALLPFYFLCPLKMFGWHSGSIAVNWKTIFLYFVTAVISVFMDGYSFIMFATGTSILFVYTYISCPDRRKLLLKIALPVHISSFTLAYLLFASYIGKSSFEAYDLSNFRGWGLDLSFVAIPTRGSLWLFDFFGLSIYRGDELFFGDGSVWKTTFCLPLVLAGMIAWWLSKKNVKLATGALAVAVFAFYMALGPSLKINSTKPTALSVSQPGQLSAGMPAELAIMPTGSALISKYVPGFNVMRASYRWSALGIFALWLLVMVQLATTPKKNRLIWIGVLSGIIVFNLPHIMKNWRLAIDSRVMFQQIDNELVKKLQSTIKKNEVVAFLPYSNDFIANYLAPTAGFKTYNIGGDKNLAEAQKKWPVTLIGQNLDLSQNNTNQILNLLTAGDADVVVIPYFDMLHAAHSWPCESTSRTGIYDNGPEWNKNIVSSTENAQETEIPVSGSNNFQNIYISVPEATSPRAISDSSDDRILGISLHNITLKPNPSNGNIQANDKNDFYSIDVDPAMKNRSTLLSDGWYSNDKNFIWSEKLAALTIPVPDKCFPDKCNLSLKYSVFGATQNHPVNVRFSNASEICPDHARENSSKVINALQSSPYLQVLDGDLFATVRLRSEFSGAASREALRRVIISNIRYPLVFGKELTWAPFILQAGWNTSEAQHVWSTGKSSLLLPVPVDCSKKECHAELKFNIFGSSPTRPVLVKFDTQQAGKNWHKELTSIDGRNYSISVPLTNSNESQKLEISVPMATSPLALGISDDGRTLGLGLQRIDLIIK
ncbi:hypothetical protein [Sodalis sp. RH16]|uniref:hypothetical protein n=1 Tax=Sodalis sp. RH16 TaxID=3394331 RepID=UPI0039B52449